MAREKPHYRENLQFLHETYNKLTFTKGETAKMIGITYDTLKKLIVAGDLTVDACGKVTVGSLARYLSL